MLLAPLILPSIFLPADSMPVLPTFLCRFFTLFMGIYIRALPAGGRYRGAYHLFRQRRALRRV